MNRDSVQHYISARRQAMVSSCVDHWWEMGRTWQTPHSDRAVWLTYASNYLFFTHGIRWAVDPLVLSRWLTRHSDVDVDATINDLDFVLLTHAHGDHTDPTLWSRLKESNCQWVVPEHLVQFFTDKMSLGRGNFAVAVPGEELAIAGTTITPFESPHHEELASGEIKHVDSTGYLVRVEDRSYLLPGDIRTYDPSCINTFKDVSVVFAHVFLGRGAALDTNPPLLEAFVDFYLSCRPGKIVLAHINELSREPEDCWLESHANRLAEAFGAAAPDIEIIVPEWYEETAL